MLLFGSVKNKNKGCDEPISNASRMQIYVVLPTRNGNVQKYVQLY